MRLQAASVKLCAGMIGRSQSRYPQRKRLVGAEHTDTPNCVEKTVAVYGQDGLGASRCVEYS